MSVIGWGQSDLDAVLVDVLKAQDRVAKPEPTPEKGFYFRSDHFNFAKKGVPALYAKGGVDLREGGEAAGRSATDVYTRDQYHKAADQFDASWKLDGVIEDINAYYEVGKRVADGSVTPAWSEGSEFKAARPGS
jgi:Zn-dependent M28 family amino/carboxypeptidase